VLRSGIPVRARLADALPRKELYESWEVARRARKLSQGGRVLDLAVGHALIAHLALIMDPALPGALAIDLRRPDDAAPLAAALMAAWPRLLLAWPLVPGVTGGGDPRADGPRSGP